MIFPYFFLMEPEAHAASESCTAVWFSQICHTTGGMDKKVKEGGTPSTRTFWNFKCPEASFSTIWHFFLQTSKFSRTCENPARWKQAMHYGVGGHSNNIFTFRFIQRQRRSLSGLCILTFLFSPLLYCSIDFRTWLKQNIQTQLHSRRAIQVW